MFSWNYLIVVGILAFFAYRWFKFQSIRKKLPEYLKQGAAIVDVRTPAEFASGHASGSINIPLQELANKTGSLDSDKPVVLCCASGSRSGMAVSILKNKGFKNVVNAGPWRNVSQ